MSPVTHVLVSWLVANTARLNHRERATVTIAGVAPDIDGLPVLLVIFSDTLNLGWNSPRMWWEDYHHLLAHNLGFGLLVVVVSFGVATQRWKTAALAGVSFHLHLLGDIVGARGPDGYQWPIPYLMPFSARWQWTWDGQWALNAWPNILITVIALAVVFILAWRRGYSPLEMVSSSADRAFVQALRRRFPHPRFTGQREDL